MTKSHYETRAEQAAARFRRTQCQRPYSRKNLRSILRDRLPDLKGYRVEERNRRFQEEQERDQMEILKREGLKLPPDPSPREKLAVENAGMTALQILRSLSNMLLGRRDG